MPIFVIGINYQTATLALREKVFFAEDKILFYLQDLLSRDITREVVLLSTCNRTEIYCEASSSHIEAIKQWFYTHTTLDDSLLHPLTYIYQDKQAIAHIMNVACGLNSMVLGEPQILGQMKRAFSESCAASAVHTLFHRLFQSIFTLAKEIRTTTLIGACPMSLVGASVQLAKKHLPMNATRKTNIAIVGAGETSELLVRYLKSTFDADILILNRQLSKAADLGQKYSIRFNALEYLPQTLEQADIVFSATGSVLPLISVDMVNPILTNRLNPLVFMDLAVPRDVDPLVGKLSGVYLYCVDDLKNIVEKNRKGREHAAMKAKEMIDLKSNELIQELETLKNVSHTIRAYRSQVESICRMELAKAQQQLHLGLDPSQVLNSFATAFTKKLLHTPSAQLRQAGGDERLELLRVAKQLFAIPDQEADCL